ncbi:WG repeat-containing protein [Chitinophaga sp. YIM B06452]|uniref:WG repeat-containing protein n=1 Tax=Chitinophaga sp. YIM B06452 TaxID=3082158 RepID=UPI0031FEFC9B
MNRSYKLLLTLLLLFSGATAFPQNLKEYKDPAGVFQVSVPGDWKEQKARGRAVFALESPNSKDARILLETNKFSSLNASMSLNELANTQLEHFKEQEAKGGDQLTAREFISINGKEWWMVDYTSANNRYKYYQTIHNRVRYSFYYTNKTASFDEFDQLALSAVKTFVFLNKDLTVYRQSEASPDNTVAAADIPKTQGASQTRAATISLSNAKAIPAVDQLFPFTDGFAIVKKGKSTGVINASGKMVIEFNRYIFDDFNITNDAPPMGFRNGSCVVRSIQTGKLGLIDTTGKLLIPAEYMVIHPYDDEGWARATGYKRDYYFINRKGVKIPIASCFMAAYSPTNPNSALLQDMFRGGAQANEAAFGAKIVAAFNGNISPGYTKDGKMSYFDRAGKQVIAATFNHAGPFNEGLAWASREDEFGEIKYGFIDTKGNTVIPFKFTNLPGSFYNGLAYVVPADRSAFQYGFINKKGEVVIKLNTAAPIVSDGDAPHFEKGFLRILEGSKMRILDTTGKQVASLAGVNFKTAPNTDYYNVYNAGTYLYDSEYGFSGRYIRYVNDKHERSILDLKQNKVVTTHLSHIGEFDPRSGLALFRGTDQQGIIWGYINGDGNVVLVNKQEKSEW